MKKIYAYLILILIACVYLGFRINVHTWETYYYTGCLDHFIPVQDMKPPTMELNLPYEKLICLHYTQHPILYYLTYVICTHFFSLKDGLLIVQLFNIVSGIFALFLCYKICFLLSRSRLLAVFMMSMIAFTDVYWYQCLSGEVYIQPFLFLLLSFYFLMTSDMITSNVQSMYQQIVLAILAAACAMAFHMFSALFYFVILFFLIEMKRKHHDFHLLFMTGISLIIMSVFFLVTYVVPYLALFQSRSITDWFQFVFLHTHHWGIWHVPFRFVIFEIMWSFIIGLKHLLHAIVSGFSLIAIILRMLILITFSYSAWFYFFRYKEKKVEHQLLLLWFFVYFVFITTNIPMVNDYWIFIVFPMIVFVILILKQCMKFNHLMNSFGLALCLIMSINFFDDIYPKTRIRKDDFFILSQGEKSIKEVKEIVMIGNKTLLGEIWHLHQIYQDKKFYYHAPDVQFQSRKAFLTRFEKLIQRINAKQFLLIIDGTARDAVRISRIIKQLDIKSERIFRMSKEYQTNELKTSMGLNTMPVTITIYGFQIIKD